MTMECAQKRQIRPANWRSTARRFGRELLAGSVVTFLLFGPYLSQFLRVGPHIEDVKKGRNACWFLWQPHDIAILLGCMLAIAAIAVICRELLILSRSRRLLHLFDHVFVLALGAGVLANVWFHTQRPHGYHISQFGMEMQTAWLILWGIAGYSLASGSPRLIDFCTRACQIVSPAILIVAYQLWCLPTLMQRMDPLQAGDPAPKPIIAPTVENGPDTPVFLFIFDEWSYRRTYRDGRVRSELPHIESLSRQVTTFHNAYSPGPKTVVSIPSMLRGNADLPELMGLTPGFIKNGEFTPSTAYPSIFTAAGCQNYRKIMVQWGFAVSMWVTDELDVARAYSCYPRGDGWLDHAALHVYNAAFFWTDPWTIFAYEKLKSRVEDAYTLQVYARIREDISKIIRNEPNRTFAIIHYPLPHPPYLLDDQGNYRGHDPQAGLTANADGYERNLACLDRLIGEIVSDMKHAGRFENSLLILTSDHTWRQDPQVSNPGRDELTHVPLIIKLPGQTQPQQITDDFRTCHLGEFIAHALGKQPRPESIAMRVP